MFRNQQFESGGVTIIEYYPEDIESGNTLQTLLGSLPVIGLESKYDYKVRVWTTPHDSKYFRPWQVALLTKVTKDGRVDYVQEEVYFRRTQGKAIRKAYRLLRRAIKERGVV